MTRPPGAPLLGLWHGGRDRGGRGGGHGPSNNLVGGHNVFGPQYFALECKILTLGLMQREENMFRVPLCWMCVHCKIHYLTFFNLPRPATAATATATTATA